MTSRRRHTVILKKTYADRHILLAHDRKLTLGDRLTMGRDRIQANGMKNDTHLGMLILRVTIKKIVLKNSNTDGPNRTETHGIDTSRASRA